MEEEKNISENTNVEDIEKIEKEKAKVKQIRKNRFIYATIYIIISIITLLISAYFRLKYSGITIILLAPFALCYIPIFLIINTILSKYAKKSWIPNTLFLSSCIILIITSILLPGANFPQQGAITIFGNYTTGIICDLVTFFFSLYLTINIIMLILCLAIKRILKKEIVSEVEEEDSLLKKYPSKNLIFLRNLLIAIVILSVYIPTFIYLITSKYY